VADAKSSDERSTAAIALRLARQANPDAAYERQIEHLQAELAEAKRSSRATPTSDRHDSVAADHKTLQSMISKWDGTPETFAGWRSSAVYGFDMTALKWNLLVNLQKQLLHT
jgi:hypothetical protein